MSVRISRRAFLKSTALVSATGAVPLFLARTAEAGAGTVKAAADDSILVVVQLNGGNDGLNTVVPFRDDAYYRVRPRLALKRDKLLSLNDDLGLNPSLEPLKRIFDSGRLAIIQGVGYPNPDRSHFRSMEIWHTACDADKMPRDGWLGRYFEELHGAPPHTGVAVMDERPQAFAGGSGLGVAIERPERFGWWAGTKGDSQERFARLNAGPAPNGTLDFLRTVTTQAVSSSTSIREAAERGGFKDRGKVRRDPLQAVAALIRGGLDARVYYVSYGGFDTHANQSGQHDQRLAEFAQGVGGFHAALEQEGLADRVTTMVFSEFGRRVAQNASGGTDHGTAAPMFLIGPTVRGGIHGPLPDLQDLIDQGDLRHTTDFRSVYTAVLEGWLRADARTILRGEFEKPPLLA